MPIDQQHLILCSLPWGSSWSILSCISLSQRQVKLAVWRRCPTVCWLSCVATAHSDCQWEPDGLIVSPEWILGTLPASVYMRMSALKYSDGDVKYSYEVPTRPGRISSTPPHTHLPCAVSQYRPRRTPVRVLSLCKAEERNLTATKWNDF